MPQQTSYYYKNEHYSYLVYNEVTLRGNCMSLVMQQLERTYSDCNRGGFVASTRLKTGCSYDQGIGDLSIGGSELSSVSSLLCTLSNCVQLVLSWLYSTTTPLERKIAAKTGATNLHEKTGLYNANRFFDCHTIFSIIRKILLHQQIRQLIIDCYSYY